MTIGPCSYRDQESDINKYRIQKGLTIKQLSELSGVSMGMIAGFNNGTLSPLAHRDSAIKKDVIDIALILDVSVEKLFPRYFCLIDLQKLINSQIIEILFPEEIKINKKELWVNIYKAVRGKRPFVILRLRSTGHTLQAIADKLNLTKERVRQIENVALRQLRKRMNIEDY